MNSRAIAVLFVSLLCIAAVGFAEGKEEPGHSRATFTMANDTINVVVNDGLYPVDDFDFPLGTTNLWNLYVGFYDGVDGYYFNSFPQDGCLSLVLIGDVVEIGSDPDKVITMTFADADPPVRFTIDLVLSMLGNGTFGVRGEATVSSLARPESLENSKLYLFTDLALVGSDGGDVTAFDAVDGIFYAYDETNSPNTWFGCHSDSGFDLHYEGLPYSGGFTTLRTAIAGGNNFGDAVNGTAEDQVAGWNWDLGTVTAPTTVRFAFAAAPDYDGLAAALTDVVPVEIVSFSVE